MAQRRNWGTGQTGRERRGTIDTLAGRWWRDRPLEAASREVTEIAVPLTGAAMARPGCRWTPPPFGSCVAPQSTAFPFPGVGKLGNKTKQGSRHQSNQINYAQEGMVHTVEHDDRHEITTNFWTVTPGRSAQLLKAAKKDAALAWAEHHHSIH